MTAEVVLGLVVGLVMGALGGGGSILAIPALVYLVGQDPKAATATSLVVVGMSAVVGAAPHWRAGRLRPVAGIVFGLVGSVGSFVGTWLNRRVDPELLLLSFAGLLAATSVLMWLRASGRVAAGRTEPMGDGAGAFAVRDATQVGKLVAAGTSVGVLVGFFGVGGGFMIVPALTIVLGFRMPQAVGTSLVVIAVNAAVALIARAGSGQLQWAVIAPVTVGAALGVFGGSRVADVVSGRSLQRAFAVVLVLLSAFIVYDTTVGGGAASSHGITALRAALR